MPSKSAVWAVQK